MQSGASAGRGWPPLRARWRRPRPPGPGACRAPGRRAPAGGARGHPSPARGSAGRRHPPPRRQGVAFPILPRSDERHVAAIARRHRTRRTVLLGVERLRKEAHVGRTGAGVRCANGWAGEVQRPGGPCQANHPGVRLLGEIEVPGGRLPAADQPCQRRVVETRGVAGQDHHVRCEAVRHPDEQRRREPPEPGPPPGIEHPRRVPQRARPACDSRLRSMASARADHENAAWRARAVAGEGGRVSIYSGHGDPNVWATRRNHKRCPLGRSASHWRDHPDGASGVRLSAHA